MKEIARSRTNRIGLSRLAVLLFLLQLQCTTPDRTQAPVVVRDSAGVRIVENGGDASRNAPWELSADPVFRIGWEEEGLIFQGLSAGAVLTDGSVVVGEGDGSRVYFFDSNGGPVQEVGRNGEGPGEYWSIDAIHVLSGDSILVQDDRNHRATVLDPGGRYVRSVRLSPFIGNVRHHSIGVSPSNQIFLWPVSIPPADSMPEWISGSVVRFSDEGALVDTVFTGGMVEFQALVARDPFYFEGRVDVGSGVVLHSRSDRPEVSWIDESGRTLQVSRWVPTWHSVDGELWREYAEAYYADLRPGYDEDRAEEILRTERQAAKNVLPLFKGLHADQDGNAWLGEYSVRGRPDRYWVILRDGTRIGWIDVPGSFKILDVGEDRILGVETNEWDAQAVSVYRIAKK